MYVCMYLYIYTYCTASKVVAIIIWSSCLHPAHPSLGRSRQEPTREERMTWELNLWRGSQATGKQEH